MASSSVCWGIELGAGALKALKVRDTGKGLEVLDYVYAPHKPVFSTPELDQVEATRIAISTFAKQYDLSGATIALSVPGHSAFARFAKLPPVDPRKIRDIVKFEAVQQIPFPLEEVEWDYQTFQSPDSPDVEVGIFAMTRERVMERLSMWGESDVTPDIITLSPVAAYNAVAFDLAFSEKTPGTVILDVGTTSTDLVVAEAGRVWVRTFPIGGHQFTEALVNAFKLTYVKAEKLKREAESSKHARHVFQAMRPVFSDLAQDVQRSIGYYQSLHREANLTRVIALGSTFNIPGLKKYLAQQLQMEVVQLDSFQQLTMDGPRAGEFQSVTGQFATAYGLALQGLGLETINANLMPALVLREAMWRRKIPWFGVAAGLAIVAGGVSFAKPIMDRGRVNGVPRPAVIDQAKSEKQRLNSEWTKVSANAAADYRGANALQLLENREIYAWLAQDFGAMLADAQQKALAAGAKEGTSQAAGFLFNRFDTKYLHSTADPDAAAAAEQPGARRPRRGSRRQQDAAVDPNAPGTVASGETGPRVQVVLEVATTQANPERFVSETIPRWIQANATRDGVPYTLKYIRWEPKARQTVPLAAAAAEDNRNDPLNPGSPMGALGNLQGLSAPQGQVIGPGATRPGQQMNPADLAPLPPAPPRAEPGETITTFQIFFEAILKTSAQPENPA